MEFEFRDLEGKSIAELEEIKKQKMDELYELQQKRYLLINNILSVQGMIQLEINNRQGASC